MENVESIFPILETERLLFRQLALEDVDAIFALFSDPEVMKLDGGLTMKERWEAEHFVFLFGNPIWYQTKHSITWAFVEKESGKVIGTGGFKNWNDSSQAEVGLDLIKNRWKNGYGQEAIKGMVSFAFHLMGLDRVIAVTLPQNRASVRLLERCGFTPQGVINHYPHMNQSFQAISYVLHKNKKRRDATGEKN